MAAITSAVIGAGTALYGARQARRQGQQQADLAREGIEAADPYREFRGEAAVRLNNLMKDPSKITETGAYKARMQAVQRQLAAQGYTGSGNALVEAAEAAGTVYQQEFENEGRLAGAFTTPGGGYGQAMETMANSNAQNIIATGGVGNNLANLALTVGDRFNKPAIPVQPIARTTMPVNLPRITPRG
jgi:hypothetical protein